MNRHPRVQTIRVLLSMTLLLTGCATPHPLVHPQWQAHPRQRLGIVPLYYEVQTDATTPQAATAFQQRVAADHVELANVVQQCLRGKPFMLMNTPLVYQGLVRSGTMTAEAHAGLDAAIQSLVDANRFVADRLYSGSGPPLDVTMGASVQALPRVLGVTADAWLWIIITGTKESGTSYGQRMGSQILWSLLTLIATLGFAMLVPNPQRGHSFIASALVVEPQTGAVLWWNRLSSSGDPRSVRGDVRGALRTILKDL